MNAWKKQTVLAEHELPGTARHDPLAYLQNRTVDWLDHQLAARELLELDVASTPLVVEHEYPQGPDSGFETVSSRFCRARLPSSAGSTKPGQRACCCPAAPRCCRRGACPTQGTGRQPYLIMTDYRKARLFLVSSLALTMAGVGSALRANTAGDLQRVFFDPIDSLHSAQMIGSALGVAFLGFAFTIAIGSPLLDKIGMGRLLGASGACFIMGTLIVIFAGNMAQGAAIYNVIWVGMVITGIGWGLVETVINPLAATLYPEEKTARLNLVHAYWPGGIIVGGLIGLGIGQLNMGWQWKLAVVVIPATVVVIWMPEHEVSADRTRRWPESPPARRSVKWRTRFSSCGSFHVPNRGRRARARVNGWTSR